MTITIDDNKMTITIDDKRTTTIVMRLVIS